MKEIFKLSPIEEIAKKTLRILVLVFALIWIKFIYNQETKINQNFILVPCMYIIGILLLLIYTINSFTSGNMVRNWIFNSRIARPIFNFIFSVIKSLKKMTQDNAIILTTRVYGIIPICVIFFLIYKCTNFLLR